MFECRLVSDVGDVRLYSNYTKEDVDNKNREYRKGEEHMSSSPTGPTYIPESEEKRAEGRISLEPFQGSTSYILIFTQSYRLCYLYLSVVCVIPHTHCLLCTWFLMCAVSHMGSVQLHLLLFNNTIQYQTD